MSDNLILEHLRYIRARVDQIADDMGDLKLRMTGLEGAMALVKREIAFGDETSARHQVAVDTLRARLERIERRMELNETH